MDVDFADLVDLEEMRLLCESFTALTGAVTAVLDLEGTVLVATGWQDICTQFHRRCPASAARCFESDTVLAGGLREGNRWNVYSCKNGLVDAAVPIVVGGKHVANFFTGQFLFAPPDRNRFAVQAEELGFDRDEYLAALERVPVFSEEYARKLMDFLGVLAAAFGELGLARLRAEDAALRARTSEERFALAMDATQDGLFDFDVATGEIYCNRNFSTMLGYQPGEIPYDLPHWKGLIFAEDWPTLQKVYDDSVSNRIERFEVEYRVRHRDGDYRWILGRGSTVARDSAGRALRIIGTHTDVTVRHRAEERTRQLEAQLAHLQKLESIGRLAGGVAHDINNMLSVVLGHTEFAREGVNEGEPLASALEQIEEAVKRSAGLTQQLLAFARKQEIVPIALDLNLVVENVIQMLQRLIGENITISWRPSPNLWQIKADATQMSQVLTSLCVNARDAIDGTGLVVVETQNRSIAEAHPVGGGPGDYVCLSVQDTGHGMDAETQARIFEPFYTTRTKEGGSGLGLASVYGAVRQNGGFIEVKSEVGKGSTFTLWLPRCDWVGASAARATNKVEANTATILLVEDESALLVVERRMLERLSYRVLTANSPKEAIQLASQQNDPIDLLLTDVVMPEMDGKALAAQLRAARPGLRCLYMSGYTADVIAHHGVIEAEVHFLPKPFTRVQLANAVRHALEDTSSLI